MEVMYFWFSFFWIIKFKNILVDVCYYFCMIFVISGDVMLFFVFWFCGIDSFFELNLIFIMMLCCKIGIFIVLFLIFFNVSFDEREIYVLLSGNDLLNCSKEVKCRIFYWVL